MICPSALFANCLLNVMHPGITDKVKNFAAYATRHYGYDHTEQVLQRHMNTALCIYTNAHHRELVAAVNEFAITFIRVDNYGCVSLPCNTRLGCTPTDHELLYVHLLSAKASCVHDILDELRNGKDGTNEFWQLADKASIECTKRQLAKQ